MTKGHGPYGSSNGEIMHDLQKFFRGKKILITGHTGFMGGWLAQILVLWGADVVGVALEPSTNPDLFTVLQLQKRVRHYVSDIRNTRNTLALFLKERPEIVFHLAAQPIVRESYDDPLFTFETNILGTANILHAIKETSGVRAGVIVTTDKVYEEHPGKQVYFQEHHPLGGYDPYSASKAAAEIVTSSYLRSFFSPKEFGKQHEILISSVRVGNILGGGDWAKDRLIPDLVRSAASKKRFIIRNPDFVRPWQHVLDPLRGYLLLAKKLCEGKKEYAGAWNFGPRYSNYVPVRVVVEKALAHMPTTISVSLQGEKGKREAPWVGLNTHKAKTMLGWHPRMNLDETILHTMDWYNNFLDGSDMIAVTNGQIQDFFKRMA